MRAPVYSHLSYDVVPDEQVVVRAPDVLLVEGLNVLQPPRTRADGGSSLAVSDFFDFSIYVDAAEPDMRRWYVERFLRLRDTAFADPASYFHRYAGLDDAAAVRTATSIWDSVNGPNLAQNILPTRGRATLVLEKGPTTRYGACDCASSEGPTARGGCARRRRAARRQRRPGRARAPRP